jgi:hypothetical protein
MDVNEHVSETCTKFRINRETAWPNKPKPGRKHSFTNMVANWYNLQDINKV